MKCGICFDEIYMPAYKSSCNCKIYYHLDCIQKWYKFKKKKCIICKKKDISSLKNLENLHNKIYNFVFNILILIIILIYFLYWILSFMKN